MRILDIFISNLLRLSFRTKVTLLLISFPVLIAGYKYFDYQSKMSKITSLRLERIRLKNRISRNVATNEKWPSDIKMPGGEYNIEYTFNHNLTKYIKRLLKRYRSDFTSVVVIDNNSGEILGLVSYERKRNKFNDAFSLSTTHPSASIFKVITAAGLLEKSNVTINTLFNFRGKGTTLYKYQLTNKKTRWSRYQTLEQAFALSNNVIFGKAAMGNMTGMDIFKMASEFGFNRSLMKDIALAKSTFHMPKNQYNLAELASGFNRETLIGPIHAAQIASIVANNGMFKDPKLISRVINKKSGKNIWSTVPRRKRILNLRTSSNLQEMMESTVSVGTARSNFRKMKRKFRNGLSVGGKTGTITGGIPHGKRDWFIAYAMPKYNTSDKGISVSVMNVNINKWYVKSTYLAKNIIEYYYSKISPLEKSQSQAISARQKAINDV